MAKLLIGIDFGTSNIKVSKWNEKKKDTTMIKLSKEQLASNASIPNVIGYKENFKIVGSSAISYERENKVDFIKRKLEVESWSQNIASINKTLTATDIAGDIFEWIFEEIKSKNTNDIIEQVVITVPVCYSEVQKERIKKAAQRSNIKIDEVITEPIAAVFSQEEYFEEDGEETVLVFDFGGGTLDLSLINIDIEDEDTNVTVLSSGGLRLGGVDITQLIFDELIKSETKEIYKEYEDKEVFEKDLFDEVENLKINLFSDDDDEVCFDFTSKKGTSLEIDIKRKDVYDLFDKNKYKEKILDLIEKLIDEARIDKEDITRIKLVGGTSQIDYFQNIIYEYFEENDDVLDLDDIDGDDIYNAVSQGATRYIVKTKEDGFVFKNKIAFSLGYSENNLFEPLLKKNSKFGHISPKKTLRYSELENDNIFKIYQMFDKNSNTSINDSNVIYAGMFDIDKSKYSNKDILLYELQMSKKGEVLGRFYDYTVDQKIVLIEEKTLNIGG